MKNSRWSLIIGLLLIAINLLGGAYNLSQNPSEFLEVNVSSGIMHLLWTCFGLYLVINYLKSEQRKDASDAEHVIVPDSTEDKAILKTKLNRTIAYFIIVLFIGSTNIWLLNNYLAGLTLNNIGVIFDVVLNLILIYFAINLLRNKDVWVPLSYTIIIYTFGGLIIYLSKKEWLYAMANIMPAVYFIFAMKMPLNRKYYRLSNMVVLPMVIVLLATFVTLGQTKITAQQKTEARLEQEYVNANTDASTAYTSLIQKQLPSQDDILDAENKIIKRNEKLNLLMAAIKDLQTEYQKQFTTPQQKNTLRKLENDLAILTLYQKQGAKLEQFTKYYKSLNFKSISDLEIIFINRIAREIEDFNSQARDLQLTFDNK